MYVPGFGPQTGKRCPSS